jgi:hypothetical protein
VRDTRGMRPHDISEELQRGESLLQRADRLQREAQDVLDDLELPTFLAAYGHPRIVGSAALGLMTWRDIDVDVEVFDEIEEDEVWDTARYLLGRATITLVSVADDRSGRTACRVPSMYVGARYRSDESAVWKIDIRFVRSADAVASSHLDDLGAKLTPETRQRILAIKDAVSNRLEYGQTLSGVDVYRAVRTDRITAHTASAARNAAAR